MPTTATRAPCARLMASLAQSRRFTLSARALAYIRALFTADRADEDEVAATIRTVRRETGNLVDPHTAVGIAVAEKELRDPAVPMVVLSTAHPAKFPDAVEAACGVRPRLPEWLSDLDKRPERVTVLPVDQSAVERFVLQDEPRRAGRSGSMSVEVTDLEIRHQRRDRHHAASRDRLARRLGQFRQPRRAAATSTAFRISSSTWRSRARSGAARAQIAEEIEAVGGDLNAATGAESTAYYARVLKADVPLALDVLADILSEPAFDPRGAAARAERHRPGDRRRRRHARRSRVRASAGHRLSRPAARPLDPRHGEDRALVRRSQVARLSGAALSRAGHHRRRSRRRRSSSRGRRRGAAFCRASTARRARRRSRRASAAAATSRSASSSRCTSRSRLPGVSQHDPALYSLQVFTNILGGGMSSRLFQEAREKRGLCYSIYSFHVPYSDVGMFGLYAGTDAADTSELMRLIVDEIANTPETISEPEIARAKAQMKAGLLMALESSGERIGQLARQMIAWGRPIPLDELVEKVEAVTVESARAAGRALITPRQARDRRARARLRA